MTSSASSDQLIEIGQLKKPYGIKGWLWVFSLTQQREQLFAMQPFYIKTASGTQTLSVKQWRQQGSGLVAQFNEIPDRTVAETMHGVKLWVSASNLPKPGEDEYYWSDLVGLQVINQQGEYLGDIQSLFETGAHDVMVVKPTGDSLDDSQRLIPWHQQTLVAVDMAAGRVTVDWQADY